ncbi:hypothetical protein LX69_02696 [Breznakibacter xylanolyticus]|uniref:Uncharacterized protein n=1 Tax=Breznakibacter xylanolyticus TaxID=990 RepID=A0A2W7N049_9BACT|nr:hypothetical protein LX69_02696 [Breznakibacter xylanolyticus]
MTLFIYILTRHPPYNTKKANDHNWSQKIQFVTTPTKKYNHSNKLIILYICNKQPPKDEFRNRRAGLKPLHCGR